MNADGSCERCHGRARCYCGPAYEEREAICDIIQTELVHSDALQLSESHKAFYRIMLRRLERKIRARNDTYDHRDTKTRHERGRV